MKGIKTEIENTRICYVCKKEFSLDANNFYRSKRCRFGFKYECKECAKDEIEKYRKENKNKIRETAREWEEKHKEEIKERQKKQYLKNKESDNERSRNYYKDNKKELRIKYKKYRDNYYAENREKKLKYTKDYRNKNREKINKKAREYEKTDVNSRMRRNLSSRIRIAVKVQSSNKAYKTMELIGCKIEDLRSHLESKFVTGMSWENYGRRQGKWGWEIDHIVPCACFDLTKEEEQKKCFHWTNLQPLWRRDNSSKNHSFNGKGFRKNSIIK